MEPFHFTSPSWSVNPRSQCLGRAGEEELSQVLQVLVQVCGGEAMGWEVQLHGAVLQSRGHSPTPACSLHGHSPAGSRIQFLAVFSKAVTSDHSCTGCLMPNRASISGEIFVASTNPFSPKDCKHFQGLGWSSSASNSSATQQQKGTTFLHCQLSHLLLNRSSQKISSRRSNTLVYSRRV